MASSPRFLVFCSALAVALPTIAFARTGAQAAPPTTERVQYVRVSAKDYQFDAPNDVNEGIVTFHLVNEGSDVHQLSVVEVGVGHTIKEFFDAMRLKGVPPAWAVTVGMTPTIPPGAESFVTMRILPGHYVLACMIPAKDGRSHVEKGMYRWVTVRARPSKAAPAGKKP